MSRALGSTEIRAGRDTARFAWLLVALLAALALPPLLLAADVRVASLRLGLAAVLIAALVLVGRQRRPLWIGIALAAPTLVLDWLSLLLESRTLAVLAAGLTIAFFGLVIANLVDALLRAERVTTDTILGGICVYLLLGLGWVSAYTLVEILHPGSLLLLGEPLRPALTEPYRFTELLYFSFVTLTTLGYGDILPATPAARALASGEAVFGQLYVAIFVARLVGLHLHHVQQRRR